MTPKMAFLTTFFLFSAASSAAQAQWVVTNPVSDTIRLAISQIQSIQTEANKLWVEFKSEYKCQSALKNDPPSALNFDPPLAVVFSCC